MKRSIIFIISLLGATIHSFAQAPSDKARSRMEDSVKLSYLAQAAFKYPTIRQANISTEFRTSGSTRSKLYGQDFYEGKAQIMRVRANFNIPIAQVGKYKLTTSLGALHQRITLEEEENYSTQEVEGNLQKNLTTLITNASITRSDSLFGVPFILNLGVSGVVDPEFNRSRFNFTGLASFQIKRTAESSLLVGALFILDPSSPVPIIPFVSYSRKLKAIDAELFADFPSRLVVRKEISPKNAFSFGTEIGGDIAFFDFHHPLLPKNAILTNLDLKTGILFEHLLTRKVVVGVKGGVASVLNSRVFPKGQNADDYFLQNRNGTVPFLEV